MVSDATTAHTPEDQAAAEQTLLRIGRVVTTEGALTDPQSPLTPPSDAPIVRLAVRTFSLAAAPCAILALVRALIRPHNLHFGYAQTSGAARRGQLHLRQLHHPFLPGALPGCRCCLLLARYVPAADEFGHARHVRKQTMLFLSRHR